MITVNKLSLQYGGRYIFDDVSFATRDGDRIGLTGKNGAGKTTLLRILAGVEKPESGDVSFPQNVDVGYLRQEIVKMQNGTVFDIAMQAFDEILELERSREKLQKDLLGRDDFESDAYAKLLVKIAQIEQQLNLKGRASLDKQVELVLQGLGFLRSDFDRPIEEFSGGWQMRVELAKLLLKDPDLLLLDEPTNHLDIESIQWLEEFLKAFNGSIILVSHDRAFLDNVCNRTLEISLGKLYDYKAPYSKYLELRKERKEKLAAAKKNQDKYIEHTETLINKFRAKKNKAKFAQTLITKLDRLEKVELDDDDLSKIKFRFPEAERSGKEIVKIAGLSKSYGSLEVLRKIDLEILRGDRLAFVGKNGEGKSTLSRIIAGMESYEGHFKLGHNVKMGYYAQNQAEELDSKETVFETIDNAASGEMRSRVRSLLGAFLFSGDDIYKKVSVLSGGEKSRLALARMLLEPLNFLVLDEPTNHLDMLSKKVLKNALLEFQGSILIVSHDRDFLKGLTHKVIEFKDKGIKEHIGDIYDFLKQHKLQSLDDLGAGGKTAGQSARSATPSGDNKQQYKAKKEAEKNSRKLGNKVERLEKDISGIEVSIRDIEVKLQDPAQYDRAIKEDGQIFEDYERLKRQLTAKMKEWEEAHLAHEKALKKLEEYS